MARVCKVAIQRGFFLTMGFLAFFSLASISIAAETERERAGLIGPVHMVVEESGTWGKGETIDREVTTYDSRGNEIESESSFYKVGASSDGKKSVAMRKSVYSHDLKADRQEKIEHLSNGLLASKTVTTDDANGHITTYESYNTSGELQQKWVTTKDAKGRLFESEFYDGDGALVAYSKTEKTLNPDGTETTVNSYRALAKKDGFLDHDSKAISTLDQRGNPVQSTIYNGDGSFDRKIVSKYDGEDRLAEILVQNADGSIRNRITDSYEFDSTGNWIKKTTSEWVMKDGKLLLESTSIRQRTITYYKTEQPSLP